MSKRYSTMAINTWLIDIINVGYHLHAEIKCELATNGNHKQLSLRIDNDGLTFFVQQFKNHKQTGVLTGKDKFDIAFQHIAKKFASIKRNFFAAPFQIMLETARDNVKNNQSKILPNFSYFPRPDKKQKIWLAFEKTQFTAYFGITFEDRFQQQLGKILFSELVDAKKHVQNSPSVSVSQSELPKFLVGSFPEEKTSKYSFSNGIIAFTLFGQLVRNSSGMATFLAGFRTYSYYHIQASKCYLHSRVLKRIQRCHKDLSLARIEPFTNK